MATTANEYITEAAKLSGCAWKCHGTHKADGDGGGYDKCCSHCQMIADALAKAANEGPQRVSSDTSRMDLADEQRALGIEFWFERAAHYQQEAFENHNAMMAAMTRAETAERKLSERAEKGTQ